MKAKTIRVLVWRTPNGFRAATGAHEGQHPNSSTLAARAAAAQALEVSEAAVELTPIGPDMLEATVRTPASPVRWDLVLLAGLSTAVVVALGLIGGAR